MTIFRQYTYFITTISITTIYIFLLFFNKNRVFDFFKKHKRGVEITAATLFTAIIIWYFTYWSIKMEWHHMLLGDLCAFLALAFIPVLISGNQVLIKSMAPWAVYAGSLTMIASVHPFTVASTASIAISYFKHVFILLFGFILIGNYGVYTKRDLWNVVLFIIAFMSFVILTSGTAYWITGEKKWAMYSTAALEPAYEDAIKISDTKTVRSNYAFMKDFGMPYPFPTIIFYTFSVIATPLIARIIPRRVQKIIVQHSIAE